MQYDPCPESPEELQNALAALQAELQADRAARHRRRQELLRFVRDRLRSTPLDESSADLAPDDERAPVITIDGLPYAVDNPVLALRVVVGFDRAGRLRSPGQEPIDVRVVTLEDEPAAVLVGVTSEDLARRVCALPWSFEALARHADAASSAVRGTGRSEE